jgi:hypothetical protein
MSATTEKPLHLRQAEGLRALADMIEQNPEIARHAHYLRETNVWHTSDPEALETIVRAALRSGAEVKKDYYGDSFSATFTWGIVGAAALSPRASVCERVVTGTKTVTRMVPDPDAELVEVTEEVEETEWVCRPLLAAEPVPAATS